MATEEKEGYWDFSVAIFYALVRASRTIESKNLMVREASERCVNQGIGNLCGNTFIPVEMVCRAF
jgi:hypothetical protein